MKRGSGAFVTELDEAATSVVFNVKYTLGQKIFIFFLGNLIDLGTFVVKIFDSVGLDLSNFWFPMPFFEFFKAKCQCKNYRIKGAKVRLTASQADAYFHFLSESLWNFCESPLLVVLQVAALMFQPLSTSEIPPVQNLGAVLVDTLGFYTRCKCATPYNKWLDKRVTWYGKPPPGATNEFIIFNDKLKCPQKFALTMMGVFLGWVPFFSVVQTYFSYKWRLSNLLFGGIQPTFKPEYTVENFFIKYVTTGFWGLGFCKGMQQSCHYRS